MKVSGIYAIKNLINNKIYIGQSIDIKRRCNTHRYKLNHLKHPNKYLQKEWIKYGKENFIFEIIEKCDDILLKEKEKYWIKYYNTTNINKGYNIKIGGNGGNINYICSEETKKKLREANSIGKIIQLDLDGKIIKIWDSITNAANTLNLNEAAILNCVKHKFYSAYNYIWLFCDEFYSKEFNINEYIFQHRNRLNLTVLQYDLYGNIIKKWKWKEIRQNFKGYRVINKICNHNNHSLTYNKYIWMYEFDDFDLSPEYLLNCRIRAGVVKVKQYDLNNNLIKIWENDEIKKSEHCWVNILFACKNNKPYKNFIWKFE